MAIKYGDHKMPKLDEARNLWSQVAKLIMERERSLLALEEFELKASNPK